MKYVACATALFVVILLDPLNHDQLLGVSATASIMVCPDHMAHTIFYPDNVTYTCAPVGRGINVHCEYHMVMLGDKSTFLCPNHGYITGWWFLDGHPTKYRCCSQPGLYYTDKDCVFQANFDWHHGRPYKVNKGRAIPGFTTRFVKGKGLVFHNMECRYRSKKRYSNTNWK